MDATHPILLSLHSIFRWLVLIFGTWAFLANLSGWLGHKAWTDRSAKPGRWFAMFVTVQLFMGLYLYFGFGWAQRVARFGLSSDVRFFAIEHLILMLLALALAHAGSAMSPKAATDTARHRRAAILFGLALLVIVAGTPWPFLDYGRPLFRLPGMS